MSCAIFFLEPSPFKGAKIDFLFTLGLITWVIYTVDHSVDGFKLKGYSGVLRYDFNYKYRVVLIPVCVFFSIIIGWLIFKNKDALFVKNGLLLMPALPIYFFLKFKQKLSPVLKMVIISVIVSAVVVSLYRSEHIFYDVFSMERLAMTLIAFLNQLVLEHFEFHEEHKELQPPSTNFYFILASRVFIWMLIILILSTVLNLDAWPYTISIFLISLFLRSILNYGSWFSKNRRYRYWADFSFVLMWPLLRLLLWCGQLFQSFVNTEFL